MTKITKKDLLDNFLACLLGIVVYIIARFLIPNVSLNSGADILLFIVSYFLGSTIYFFVRKDKKK